MSRRRVDDRLQRRARPLDEAGDGDRQHDQRAAAAPRAAARAPCASRQVNATTKRATAHSPSATNIAAPSRRATTSSREAADEPGDRRASRGPPRRPATDARRCRRRASPTARDRDTRSPTAGRTAGPARSRRARRPACPRPARTAAAARARAASAPTGAPSRRAMIAAGEEPERHREGEREPALGRIDDRAGVGAVVVEVVEDVAETAADDRPGHRRRRRMNTRSSMRRPGAGTYGPTAGVCEPMRAASSSPTNRTTAEPDRLVPDGRGVAEPQDRIEVERGSRASGTRASLRAARRPQAGSLSTSSWTAAADFVERGLLVGGELDLDDALQPARAEDDRHAHEQAVDAVLALEVARRRAAPGAGRAGSRRPSRTWTRPARRTPSRS